MGDIAGPGRDGGFPRAHRGPRARRVNHANARKEFFFATPLEVREVLVSCGGSLLDFREHAESTEFLQSVGGWPEAHKPEPS